MVKSGPGGHGNTRRGLVSPGNGQGPGSRKSSGGLKRLFFVVFTAHFLVLVNLVNQAEFARRSNVLNKLANLPQQTALPKDAPLMSKSKHQRTTKVLHHRVEI